MADRIASAQRGLDAIRTVLPKQFNWPLFCVALALMSAPAMQMVCEFLMRTQTKSANTAPAGEFGCTRNLQN
jgi:hypothetical protein